MAQSELMEEHIATSAAANHGVRKRPRPRSIDREAVAVAVAVDGFHQRVTSEDNADFERNRDYGYEIKSISSSSPLEAKMFKPIRITSACHLRPTAYRPRPYMTTHPLSHGGM